MKVCCGGYATIPSQRRRVANAPRSCVMGDACSCGERYAFIPAFFACVFRRGHRRESERNSA
jgi:hypothetical protein